MVASLVAGGGLATWVRGVAIIGASGHWQDIAQLLVAGLTTTGLVAALLAIGYPLAAGRLRGGHIAGRSLFLGTADPVALPRPRYRLGLVVAVALVVSLVVLIVDRVLPSGVAVRLYAGFGGVVGPNFDRNERATLTFLGVIVVLVLAVCVSVAALAGGPDSAGTGGLHGAAAGVLTGYLLTMVAVVARLPGLCSATTCNANLFLRGIGAFMITFAWAALTIVVLTAPLIAAIRRLVRLGREARPLWPVGVDPAPGETRRRRIPAAVSGVVGVVVAVTFVIPVTSAVFVLNGITTGGSGQVPAQILRPSGPGLAGSVAVHDACAAVVDASNNPGFLTDFYVKRDTAARKAAATDDPAMQAMGKQLVADNRASLLNESGRDLDALDRYCNVSALSNG